MSTSSQQVAGAEFPSSGGSDVTVNVFCVGDQGGNPCTIVQGPKSSAEMNELARTKGHECCFVDARPHLPRPRLRFFAPSGEMDMCGHATLAAGWWLSCRGKQAGDFETAVGTVNVHSTSDGNFWFEQNAGIVEPTRSDAAMVALQLRRQDLITGRPIVNASTGRMKTLVPLASLSQLQSLAPRATDVRAACDAMGSTGLYPWVFIGDNDIEARQFPRSAGYLEDPATGVAAAALFFALSAPPSGITIQQGRAMGRLSRIRVIPAKQPRKCLVGGRVRPALARGTSLS